jgi:hypothetical protein
MAYGSKARGENKNGFRRHNDATLPGLSIIPSYAVWAVPPVEFEIATISHHSTTDSHKTSELQNVTNQTEL